MAMDNNAAERALRNPIVGRKNYYGSGSVWSAHFAAMMFSVLQTVLLWSLNPHQWLSAFLQACADHGARAQWTSAHFSLADDARTPSSVSSPCARDVVTLCQRFSGDRRPRSRRYLLTPDPVCRFLHMQTDGPMALSRCTQKGERLEGLSDDAEPTSNVAGACCIITSELPTQ